MLVFGNTCLCSDIPKLLLNRLGTHVCVLIFLSFYFMLGSTCLCSNVLEPLLKCCGGFNSCWCSD